MKKLVIGIAVFAAVLLCLSAGALAAENWTLASPSGEIEATLYLSDAGNVTWSATLSGRPVLPESPLGINNTYADFRSGLTFLSEETALIDESYSMISGKFSTYVNKANELTLSFTKDEKQVDFIIRAYDDGVAARYFIPGTGTYATSRLLAESTGLTLEETDVVNVMPYQRSHEGAYSQFNGFSGMTNGDGYNLPCLVSKQSGDYMLFTEADLDSRYAGAVLSSPVDTDGLMSLVLDPRQNADVSVELPFASPWRVAVIGSLAKISETMIIENLSPACALEDASWIDPGVTSWAWLTRGAYPQSSKDTWIAQIDFAAAIGWEYVLLDDGWQRNPGANEYYPWINEVIEYANEKGVGLLVWSHRNNLDTDAKRDRLQEWADMGIKGVKADFFDEETQSTLAIYDAIVKASADAKLMINFHGANKPTGQRRSYPHLLAREGVLGAEQSSTSAAQDCLLPFTRNAVGPMDFTPLQDPWFSASAYATAHNTALAITVETGIQCLADYPDAYLKSPARDFFTGIPSVWDETVCVGADLREYYAVARRSGETWYVGAVNNGARTESVALDFLEDGVYYAQVYKEGASRNSLAVEIAQVTKDSVIEFSMGTASGGAMKITRDAPVLPESLALTRDVVTLQEMRSESVEYQITPAETNFANLTFESDNPSVASVSAQGVVTALKAGRATVTARTVNGLTDSFEVCVYEGFELGSAWSRVWPTSNAVVNDASSVTIKMENGDIYGGGSQGRNIHFTAAPEESDFEITAKLIGGPYGSNYHQTGLVVMLDQDNYFSTIRRYHSGFGGKCFMTVSEANRSASEGNQLADNAPETVWLRIVKAGSSFTGYYSAEGADGPWNAIYTRTNDVIGPLTNLKVGFYASGAASGTATIEDFRVNGELVPFSENVDGFETADNWSIVRETGFHLVEKSENRLSFRTDWGDLYGTGNNRVRNIYVTDPGAEDFTVEVDLTGDPSAPIQTAGLIAYSDDDNYVSAVRRFHSGFGGKRFQVINETGGSAVENPNNVSAEEAPNKIRLRLVKSEDRFSASYSADEGATWEPIYDVTNAALAEKPNLKVGVYGQNGTNNTHLPVTFENFTVNGVTIPFHVYRDDTNRVFSTPLIVNDDDARAGSPLTVETYVNNSATPVRAFLAAYDADGRLTDVDEALIDSGTSATLTVEPAGPGCARLFIWDGSFAPLKDKTDWEVVAA